MANKSLKTLDIITVLMKNDRVREFKWLDTRSWEEESFIRKNVKKELKESRIKQSDEEIRKIIEEVKKQSGSLNIEILKEHIIKNIK